MPVLEDGRIGYVVKWYPKLSETFVVSELLAHEAAGLPLHIFSLRAPVDTRFHEMLGAVNAEVTYIPTALPRATTFWKQLGKAASCFPRLWDVMAEAKAEDGADVCQALYLAQEVRKRGITHLHAHFASLPGTVTRLAARIAGVPFTMTAHAKDIFHESVDHDSMRRKLRDASAVVTVTDFNVDYLRSTYDRDAQSVRRIYNGLDLDAFRFEPPRERRPLVLGVGRVIEKKGFADLVEACAILRERGRSFECEIIGGGLLFDDLSRLVDQRRLNDHVRLLGVQPSEVVQRKLREAAVLAAPCVVGSDGNRDGLPTVLLEAMAVGTPCVTTDVTGIPELVTHELTGLVARPRDPESLANQIERLLASPDLGTKLASAGRGIIEDRFDIHRNAAEIRELFQPAGRPRDLQMVTR